MSRNLPAHVRASPPVPAVDAPRPRWAGAEEPEGIDWRRVLSALKRYRWLVALVALFGTGAGVGVTRFLDATYVAQATVWIDEGDGRVPERGGPIRTGQLLHSVSWADLLTSYVVLDAVVRDQRLYLAPRSPGDAAVLTDFGIGEQFRPGDYRLTVDQSGAAYALATRDGIVLERGTVGDSIGKRLGFAWAPRAGALPYGESVEFTVLTLRDAARRLAENLQVQMDLEGNFLRLELRGTEPERIASVLNEVGDRFVDVAAELKRRKLTEVTRILEEQRRYARENLARAENALQQFQVQTITLPSGRQRRATGEGDGDPLVGNFFEMRLEREQLRRDRDAITRVLAGAPGAALNADALGVIGAVREASELSQALDTLRAHQAELRALRHRYADEYPPLVRLIERITTLERETIPRLAGAVVADLAAREADLETRLAGSARELSAIPPRAIEEARLERAAELAAKLATTLEERYAETRLAEASAVPDVRILDPAVVPREPVKDAAPRVILIAFLASVGLGGLGAVVLDRFDPRVRYPEEVSRGMGLPILGAIPHLRRPAPGEAPSHEATAEIVEALRGVRMNLVHLLHERRPLQLTFTSPGAGDGKSFVAANLALAFAEQGYRTLLVDGDIRRGSQHRRFNVTRRPGLSDFLVDNALLGEIVRRTPYPSLSLIGCGARTREAPELLGSQRMEAMLGELASSYDVILCDSPPLTAGVDPYVLGTLMGNLLLVVRTGVSHREVAQAKLEVLSRLPIRIVGAVLNAVPAGEHDAYYAYSYYLPGYEATDEPVRTGGPKVI